MYTIKLGKTSKKINETSHSYTNIGAYNVALKRPCTIDKPVFTLKTDASFDTLSRANYLEWLSDLQTPVNGSSYYWVNSVKFIANDLIEISCSRDPFATFKSSITGYTGFVARATSSFDTMITDPNILSLPNLVNEFHKTYLLKNSATDAYIFSWKDYDVSYTWTTIGTQGCSIFNSDQVPNATLFEMLNLQGGSIWQDFQWGVTNPGQYVKDCIMLPFKFSEGDYATHNIYIGNLIASVSDIYVWEGEATPGGTFSPDSPDRFYQGGMNIPISEFTLHYPADDFRNYIDGFTNFKMRIPFVGMVEISARHLKAHHITVYYTVSAMTGKGKCQISANYETATAGVYTPANIGTYNIETGQPVAVAAGHTNQLQMSRDAIQMVRTAGDVVGTVTKPTPAGVINSTANVMSTALETAAHAASGYVEYTSFGSNGSLVETFNSYRNIEVYIQQYDSTPTTFSTERGRPVYKRAALSGFSGFVQLLAPSLSIAGATSEEISIINATLASGLYIS